MRTLAWLCLISIGWAAPAIAADAPTPEPLRYRRVLAPIAEIDQWPRGAVKYLPVEPAEFERLLQSASGAETLALGGAHLAAADYTARLDRDQLVDGRATLRVVARDNRETTLALDPCNIALGRLTWAGATPVAAVAGMGDDGTWRVHVERGGELEFDWSLRGQRAAGETIHFDIDLPTCPANSLLLDLPADRVPSVDRGLVVPLEWLDEERRLWRVALGGSVRFTLTLTPIDAAADAPQFATVSQSTAYALSLQGVALSSQWLLNLADPALQRVELLLDPALALTQASVDDQPVTWSTQSDGDAAGTRVFVALPESLRRGASTLRLEATAPMQIGQLAALPRIRAAQLFWQSGRMSIGIADPLTLTAIRGVDANQTAGRTSLARGLEGAEFQCLSADAALHVAVEPASARPHLVSGTAVELSGTGATARIIADVRAASGAQFVIEADVVGNWQIDSVETLPGDMLDDWSLERAGNRRTLAIRLAKPVTPQRPVRLAIVARKTGSPVGQSQRMSQLSPVQFRHVEPEKRLLTIRAVEPYRLEILGPGAAASTELKALPAADRELLSDASRGPVFDEMRVGDEVDLVVQSRQPAFSAAVAVELTLSGARLTEVYRLQCVPQSGSLEQLLVQFSAARSNPLQWSLAEEPSRPLAAQKLGDPTAAADAQPAHEQWQVVLPRAMDEPFEIIATRTAPFDGPMAASLAGLPDASSQTGTCRISTSNSEGVRIRNNRLPTLPASVEAGDRVALLRGLYGYDPAREMSAGSEAALVLTPDGQSRSAWIWLALCDSWYDASGHGRHSITYRIESGGLREMSVTVPAAAARSDCTVWVEGERLTSPRDEASRDRIRIDLPTGKRFVTVALSFSTPASSLGIYGRLTPPWPLCDLPVLDRSWTVRMPPGYRAAGAAADHLRVQLPEATLTQRLFGPFGRPADRDGFREASFGRAAGDAVVSLRDVEALLQLLGQHDLPRAARDAGMVLDWGGLLGAAGGTALTRSLFVDRAAVSVAAITPHTPVRRASGGSLVGAGLLVLREAGLSILVHHQAILITSQAEAATWDRWLASSPYKGVWIVEPGPLAAYLNEGLKQNDSWLLPIDLWRMQPAESRPSWSAAGPASPCADTRGWLVCRLDSTSEDASLTFVHDPSLRLGGVLMFLVVFALTWMIARRRRLRLAVALLIAVAAAAVAPEYLLPVASGAVLGVVACALLAWLRGAASRVPRAPVAASPASTVSIGVPTAGLLIALALAVPSHAAEAVNGAPAQQVHQVFVPVDDNQQPTGDKLQVPEAMFRELHHRAAAHAGRSQGWLIGAAVYRAELQKDVARDQFAVDQVHAAFDLHVFSRQSRIRLPARRDDANLLSDSALLDGQPLELDWEPDGTALVFDVAEPGRYRLELALRPAMTAQTPTSGFAVQIPRVADARLELVAPAGAPEILVPTARGASRWEIEPRRLVVDLGPTDQLAVRWASGNQPVSAAIDVDQLLWWQLAPGSNKLAVRLRIRVLEGQLSELRMTADVGLRLVTPATGGPFETRVEASNGSTQRLAIRWPRPLTGQTTLDLTFVPRANTSTVAVPLIDVADVRTTRRWLAASVDPLLQYEQVGIGTSEPLTIDEFAAAWGMADATPSLALRLGGETGWQLAVSPRRPQIAGEQTLTLTIGEEATQLRYDARLSISGGSVFQLRLAAPSGIEIDRVALRDETGDHAAAWAQSNEGTLTLFSSRPLTGRQQVIVDGRLGHATRRRVVLPWLHVETSENIFSTLQVFRRPSVTVAVPPVTGMVRLEDIAATPVEGEDSGRFLGVYRIEEGAAGKMTAVVAPNRPVVEAEQVTLVGPSSEGWTAELLAALHVDEGLLDEIHVEAHDSFQEPYTTDLDAAIQVLDLPGDRRRLVLRPEKPISGEVHFQVSGRVVPGDDRLRVPHVRLENAGSGGRFVALPRATGSQTASWETADLRLDNDAPVRQMVPDAASFDFYELADETKQAALSLADRGQGEARVRLADVAIGWNADGQCRGVAVFDLDPGQSTDCQLWMPPGVTLLQARVGDLPTVPSQVGGNSYILHFGPQRLPQRITVLFGGHIAERSPGGVRLESPSLGELPVVRTLWTLYPPQVDTIELPPTAASDALQLRLTRLKNTAAIIQQVTGSGVLVGDERAAWYRRWATRLLTDRRAVERELTNQARWRSVRPASAEVRTVDEQQTYLAERLGLLKILSETSASANLPSDHLDIVEWLSGQRGTAVCLEMAGPAATLDLPPRATAVSEWSRRWMPLASLAVVVALVALPRPRRLALLAARHVAWYAKGYPQAVGIVLGLAWTLWLSPIAVGWFIVFGSVALLIWPRAARRAPLAHSSHATRRHR